jgi:hypothetical protein
MIDLCTIVFRDELDILHTQARSIDRYVQDVGTIYVVVNDDPNLAAQIQTHHWGRYQDRVCIIPRSAWGHYWTDNGWVSQQALKLAAAATSQSQYCVALDAKTIFVQPLPNIANNGRLSVGTLPVYPVFEPSRQIVNSLWDIDLQRQLGPGGVPFWFEPGQVRAMISDIERRVKQNFVAWFQDQGLLTEFLLYSGWIEYQCGIDSVAAPSELTVCNLCHSELGRADVKLAAMNTSHTVSIHRKAWTALSDAQRQQYQNLLAERLA